MKKYFTILILTISLCSFAQEDLLKELDTVQVPQVVEATFKGLKIVNFESTKLIEKGAFTFSVAHRFGSIKDGFDTFFGLDNAVTRLNFIYGLTDAIDLSVSRSSYQKLYDVALKYRLIKQEVNGFPFTIVALNTLTVNSSLKKENLPNLSFSNRMGYTLQLMFSRKVSSNFSYQLMPTVFHDNYVSVDTQSNTQYALGVGGRYKISKRMSLNFDYGYHLNRAKSSPYNNPLGLGLDIETGGHVFQLLFSNAQAMNTNYMLSSASGDWSDGDIYFGFNLIRRF